MSRRTLAVSGILLVFLTEVVLLSILVNLNMQREGVGPNLNRELLLRLRRAAPKLDYNTRQHIASLGCTGHRRGCRAGRQKQKHKQPLGSLVVVGRRHLSTPNASTAEMRQRTLVTVKTHETFVPSVFTANLRGGMVHKMDELEATLCDVDIGCITETWLNKTVPSKIANILGYVMHRSYREDGRRGGGVAVFVRHNVPCVRLSAMESANFETVWLLYRQFRMSRSVSHVVIGAVYHPPAADDRAMASHILECLDTVARDHSHAGVVLLGDFNQLRDSALLSYPLRQVIKSATRGPTVLDKIYTSLKDWYEVPVVLPNIGSSDHNSVVIKPKHRPTDRGDDVVVTVRSQDSNGRALLGQAIADTN